MELLKLIPSESKNMSSVFKRLCQSNIFYLDDNSSLKYVFECDYVRDSLVSNINEPSSKSFKKNDTIYNCIMMIRVWLSPVEIFRTWNNTNNTCTKQKLVYKIRKYENSVVRNIQYHINSIFTMD